MLRRPDFEPAAVAVARPFRIMVLQVGGAVALYRALPTLAAARRIAKSACDRHSLRLGRERLRVLADPKRPRRVYVEQWVGLANDGQWKAVPMSAGGFNQRFSDRPEKDEHRYKSGDLVECVLLNEKTRRGGWRARIVGKSNAGPVLGEPPREVSAGDQVQLRLSSLSARTNAAQFAWQ